VEKRFKGKIGVKIQWGKKGVQCGGKRVVGVKMNQKVMGSQEKVDVVNWTKQLGGLEKKLGFTGFKSGLECKIGPNRGGGCVSGVKKKKGSGSHK